MNTPCVLINMSIVRDNIAAFQGYCDSLGIVTRPHIKTHKIPDIAKMQLQLGAIGITCQKISEAEVMANAGLADILITYNIVGSEKLARLFQLSKNCRLSVTADSQQTVAGLSQTFMDSETNLTVLVECDTGAARCGVQNPYQARDLAKFIHTSPGLVFGGLMTYPPMTDLAPVQAWLVCARDLIEADGIECKNISSGGSPNMQRLEELPVATEHRIGTYVYNDRSLIEAGVCTIENCALNVVATIVSRPTPNRAVIDAGSKILTSDLLGLSGHGIIIDHPNVSIVSLSEEHGIVDLTGCDWSPEIGDQIRIIPNHACVVSNMVDEVTFEQFDGTFDRVSVLARGKIL